MKTLILSALLLTPWLVQAGPIDTNDSPVEITGSLRNQGIAPPASYRPMYATDYRDYLRTYELANGMQLNVYSVLDSVYASLGDERSHQLVAARSGTFYAKDGSMKLSVQLLNEYDVSGELEIVLPVVALGGEQAGKNVVLHIAIQ